MMTTTTCPTAEDLRAYSVGRLPEDEELALHEHLKGCERCRNELGSVDDTDDSLILELRSEQDESEFDKEPECNLALAKALGALADHVHAEPKDRVEYETEVVPSRFPERIGEYEIVRPIGRGGMGSVFLARHTKLGREVAVKILASHRFADPRMRERFDAEMKAVGRLSHPNVVIAHDAREVDGIAVLITEYIDGFDLGDILSRTGPLSSENACEIVRKVASALQYISDQGFVHRDVKPSNIMISRHGQVKLLDLGLARFEVHDAIALTGTGQAVGTPDYVSPEQVTDGRSVDHRSDIYSLGCTLFALLTGNAPFSDEAHQTAFAKMSAHVSTVPPSLSERMPQGSTALSSLVDSMLDKDPDDRPASSGKIAASLTSLSAGHDLEELVERASQREAQERPLPTSSIARSKPWRTRKVSIMTAVGASLFSLLIGIAFGLFIKITYSDGTVIELPIGGAKLVISEKSDEQDSATETAAKADGMGNIQRQPMKLTESKVDVAQPAPPKPAKSSSNKFRRPVPAIPTPGETIRRFSGVWEVERIGSSREPGPVAMFISFDGVDFIAVSARPEAVPEISHGQINRMQQDGRGLTIGMKDDRARTQLDAIVKFDDDETATIYFDPFSIPNTLPLQGRRVRNRGEVTYRLKRVVSEPPSSSMIQALLDQTHNQVPPRADALKAMLLATEGGPVETIELLRKRYRSSGKWDSMNQLKQLALSFHSYHATHGEFPGSVNQVAVAKRVQEEKIQPYSWRIAILPFINQHALYRKYRFYEPWDSENNRKLLAEMPEVFRSPRAEKSQPAGNTNYLGYATGDSALGQNGGVAMREFIDGTSNTLLLIETKSSVPWTKPEDLDSESQPDMFPTTIYALADGSVQEREDLDAERLKKMVTRNGGEIISQ